MAKSLANENDIRFSVILKTLDSCDSIREKLHHLDQLNSSINDEYLIHLFNNAGEVASILKSFIVKGKDQLTLQECCSELEFILGLPGKLEECIDDPTQHKEAIDLLEFIDTLNRKYSHQIPIIDSIYQESERQRDYFIFNLCERLEHLKDSPEDEVRKIVNYLVRCGDFSDRDLRLKYLQARDNWFNNTCEEQSSSFDNVVSVYSSGLPMIFKEYKSIFGDSNEILTGKLASLSSTDTTKEDGAIINSWLLLKTSVFIASLEVYLDTICQSGVRTPTMISDTMQKCFELTTWLASIGLDFSSQLKPLFSRALIKEVKSSIERATEKFESSFATAISKSIESLLLPVEDEILRISNMRVEEQIPKSIEHYPIFRVYCLYILDSLRWLRTTQTILSPISLTLETYASLNGSLNRVMKALSLILNTDNNSKHPILSKIAICFVTEFLTFLANYCENLFPEKVILSAIGLSKSEFKAINLSDSNKLKNFRLDLRYIAEPLKSTMPALLQTIEY